MGELCWNRRLGKVYGNDFALQVVIWLHGIHYAEVNGYSSIRLLPFNNKEFSYFFEKNIILEENTSVSVSYTQTGAISRLSELKLYMNDIVKGGILKIIHSKMKELVLTNHLNRIVNGFENDSMYVLDTRMFITNSLKVNQMCDPLLKRYVIMECIPPGSDLYIFKEPWQHDLIESLSDIYTIQETILEDDIDKQCIELFLLINKKVRKYYCSCLHYSTKFFTYIVYPSLDIY